MNNQKARLVYEAPELNVIRLGTEDIMTVSNNMMPYNGIEDA